MTRICARQISFICLTDLKFLAIDIMSWGGGRFQVELISCHENLSNHSVYSIMLLRYHIDPIFL